MKKLTTWVLAHKTIVVVSWLVLLVGGIATNAATTDKLNQKFTVPGKEAPDTNIKILKTFGNGGEGAPLLAVVKLPKPASQEKSELGALEQRISKGMPGTRVAGYASTGNKVFISKDGKTTFVIVHPKHDPKSQFGENRPAAKNIRRILRGATIAGQPVRVTGIDVLALDSGDETSGGTTLLVETMLASVLALGVLVFVFGSAVAVLPLFVAIVSIMTTYFALFLVTRFTHLSPVVEFLVFLVGLGVAIDYALLMTIRWREERTHGRSNEEALIVAGEHAGRAIVFSGITVAIGLVSMVVIPLPFLRSIGVGGMLIPASSVLVSITFLPVLLAKWGPTLDKRRLRSDDKASRAWTAWARGVVKHRWIATVVALVILGVFVVGATQIKLGIGSPDTITKGGESKVALKQLQDSGIGSGVLMPHEILTSTQDAAAVAYRAAGAKGISGAVAPESWKKGGESVANAFYPTDPSETASRDTVDSVRAAVGSQGAVGGEIAQTSDFVDATYSNFPYAIALIALITFILLARAFRSVLLPIKAVVLNLISIFAAVGILVIVWQNGHGSDLIWGIAATGSIAAYIPVIVFAFLFGLSMDYEVFILSRIREFYDSGEDTDQAVIHGVARTGRLVTSAALILFFAFASLATAPETDTKIIASGLAAGIILDATVIRALLVPAVVSLFGKWNWWLPGWLAKVLRVEPSRG